MRKVQDGFTSGSFQYVLTTQLSEPSEKKAIGCLLSLLFSLLLTAKNTNSGVDYSDASGVCTWISLYSWECGEKTVCESTTVHSAFQDSFINALKGPLSGTEFWGYQILHLHSVTRIAVGLTLKHS